MKWFGWKGAASPRPALSRASGWMLGVVSQQIGVTGDWPASYEAQVRAAVIENPVAQRAVRLVTETVGGAGLRAGGVEADDAQRAVALVRTTSGGQALIETLAMHLILHGNGYVRVLTDGLSAPGELIALRPERVRVQADRNGWPMAYSYQAGQSISHFLPEEVGGGSAPEIIHLKTINPLDDHYGLGCVGAAAGPVAIHNAATVWNKALLDNAARPSGALVYDAGRDGGALTADQFARLKAEMEAAFAGATNAGRPMLLEGGLKWQALSLSPADMDFVGLKAAAARDIALAFGVPPMLLGLPGDATYANYREANKALWRQTILPLATKMLDGIAQGLRYWMPGLTLSLDLDGVAELSDERAALWDRVGGAAFLTLDEKRTMLGLPPLAPPVPHEPEGEAA